MSSPAPQIIFIDEAQFLTKAQVFELCALSSEGVNVFAYGLRTDFQGEPFEGSQYLLAWADNIEEISSLTYSRTDDSSPVKATFNIKVDEHGQRIRKGASKDVGFHYLPVSLKDFFEGADKVEDLSS